MCTTEQTESWNCNTEPSKESNFSEEFVCIPLFLQVRLMQLWLVANSVVGSAWSTPVPPGRSTESGITSALLSSSLLPWALGHLWSRGDLPMALGVGYSLFWDNKVGFFFFFYLLCPFKIRALPWHLQWLITNVQANWQNCKDKLTTAYLRYADQIQYL